MPKIDPIVPGRSGNTKQISPAKKWCFTFNNYTEENYNFIVDKLKSSSNKFIIGREIGNQTHTKHLQGFVEFKIKVRPKSILSPLDSIHWEKAKGTIEQNFEYCSKEGNYIINGDWNIKKPVKILETNKLFPFQKSLIDIIDGPVNENKIIWVYDLEGQTGKTELVRYLNVTRGVPFAYGGKCTDIINLAFNNKSYLETSDKPTFIYNLGREVDPKCISYNSMEQISDGCIANTKFEANCFVFNKPHVIVLANCLPLKEKLTASRWMIYQIKDKCLVNYIEKKTIGDYF